MVMFIGPSDMSIEFGHWIVWAKVVFLGVTLFSRMMANTSMASDLASDCRRW